MKIDPKAPERRREQALAYLDRGATREWVMAKMHLLPSEMDEIDPPQPTVAPRDGY